MNNKYGLYVSIAIVAIGLAGIGYWLTSSINFQKPDSVAVVEDTMHTDNIETNEPDQLDAFLALHNPTEKISAAYSFALSNPDGVLDEVPCYCGCLDTNEHLSNRDCFIEHPRENSEQLFDEMGLNCGVCVATALKVEEMQRDDHNLSEIQKAIDDKFLHLVS